jgi:alpha-maltose-1-phosphate synthase
MKVLVLYPYPVEPDGQSLQGHYLVKGFKEIGVEVMSCDRDDNLQLKWAFEHFKPDCVVGVGFWGDTPELINFPLQYGLKPVPWFNADGWVANYHGILNNLPLVLATSNWVKSTYERDGVSGEHIKVMHIGFDADTFYPISEDDAGREKLREMLGIKEDEKMILTIGGDVTSKGAQEMIKALAKVDENFTKWKYVMKVWDSPSSRIHGKEERKLIRELGLKRKNFVYLEGKYSPDFMAQLINACDIYAAPSRLEGFGMIQLEAQACGKPVVSINIGGPRDVVEHEKTGFLVDVEHEIKLDKEWVYPHWGFDKKMMIEFPRPKTFAYRANIDQLAECTLKLLTDSSLRKEMGKAAAEHAFKNFHHKVIAERMKGLLEKYVLKQDIKERVVEGEIVREFVREEVNVDSLIEKGKLVDTPVIKADVLGEFSESDGLKKF